MGFAVFSSARVEALVSEHYGLSVNARALNGYDELNYLLTAGDGRRYILKIADPSHDPGFLEAQVSILRHLADSPVADRIQRCLPDKRGNALVALEEAGQRYYLRLLNFLEGEFWVERKGHSDGLAEDLGRFLGDMDRSLTDFSHPAMRRRYTWDIQTALDRKQDLQWIKDPADRRVADYFLLQFETEILPYLYSLRMAYAHNDANDYNVLVSGEALAGLIDFGDMVYTQLINNVAVACVYAMFGAADPIHTAAVLVQGYHSRYPLRVEETDLLYWLIAARLCISVTRSAAHAAQNSENEHHFVTERSAWTLLHRLLAINPVAAKEAFRKACGFASTLPAENDYAALERERRFYIGRNLSISYQHHLKIERGALQYLYDDRGRTYIDCVNNVSHVGHCHPTVVRAIQGQAARLNTNTRYLHDNLVEYAKKLTATLPSSLKVCYFTNSGSEANDLAIRMSRHYTGRQDIIVLDHAYHGTSTTAMEMSPYKFDGKGGAGKKPYIHKAMNPDLYRGPYRYDDPQAGEKYAQDVTRILADLAYQADRSIPGDTGFKGVAAFICETLLGVGGQIPLPPGYLDAVYRQVRAAGGLCIADEVQVGFGRVGKKFWGFELQDVEPDIVVLGKPIGNGHPLAAVIVKEAIAEAFNNGMEYFNTYGGNPVSMAAGLSVLRVIEEENLQAHAERVGGYLLEQLKRLPEHHAVVGDVRGSGLFIGVELVKDRQTLEPAVPFIDRVVEKMKERGYLLSTDGPLHNVLKIKPPMVFSMDNADGFARSLDEVLTECTVSAGLDAVLGGLMRRYKERVPDVAAIIQAMIDEKVITRADDIENDHIAFRTIGVPHLGIASLEKLFLHYGYERKGHYSFVEKKLDAYWYAPPEPRCPRIFISELRVGDLSARAQEIIHSYTDEVKSDPADALDLDDSVAVDAFLHSALWRTPTVADYQELAVESEYAAWVIYNRYYLNHFTISVHNLPEGYNTVSLFNQFLERKGFRLNDAGGKIKTSPDKGLLQSSTVAGMVEAGFAGGEHIQIAGSYVEFAERRVLPQFAHLPANQITRLQRREGFEAGNADKIFESTYSSQTGRK